MKDVYEDLREACELTGRELGDMVDKVRESGGNMTSADLDAIDKLTHAMKSIKTTMAMMEAEDGDGYSSRRSYNDGRMYSDGYGSYVRGRSSKRDSMGRYSSRRGYDSDMDRM